MASVFATAKTQKQPKCPPTGEWIRKTWYVYRGYYSAIHKSGIMLSAVTWMYLEMVILIEVSQTEKEKYHMISLI